MWRKFQTLFFAVFLIFINLCFCYAGENSGTSTESDSSVVFYDSGGMEATEEDIASAIEEYKTAPPATRYLMREYLPEKIWIAVDDNPVSVITKCSTEEGFLFHQDKTQISVCQMTEDGKQIRAEDPWKGYSGQQEEAFYVIDTERISPSL